MAGAAQDAGSEHPGRSACDRPRAVAPLGLVTPAGVSIATVADRATRMLCMLAALASLVIVGMSTTGLRTGDLPFLAFLVPALVLVLSLGGTLLLGIDSYRFHTVPEHRLVQRMTILIVPMLQSTAVIAIALLLQAYGMLAGHGRAGAGRSRRR